jgi:hypothetical protein
MSQAALEMKKKQAEDYFTYHPDSQEVQLEVFPFDSFPALLDYGYASGNKDSGHVQQQKKTPHLTFFADYADGLIARETKLTLENFPDKVFTVVQVRKDETAGTFQGEAWLV